MAVPEAVRRRDRRHTGHQPESPVKLPPKFGKMGVSTYIKAMFVA
jgi:hypothetical protein